VQLPRHLPLDPLNRPATAGDDPGDLQDAIPGLQMRSDGVLDLGELLRPVEPLALLAHATQPGHDSIAEDRSFLFAKHARHLDHGAAHWRRGVGTLLVAI
jgi:hypothetical protein